MLSATQARQYQQDGYLVLPGFKSASELTAVRDRAQAIVQDFDPGEQVAIFTTDQTKRHDDRYFLESGDKVRCFFEEQAFDAHGRLKQDKALSINKIGHALHDLDPQFDAFSHGPALAELAHDLGLAEPQIWQSMYIFKQPGIGGDVRWHQDASYFDTTPPSVTTFWFALEDATLDNGCLWVEPGGHHSPMRELYVRDGDKTELRRLDATPWPDARTAVALPVQAGTLVCFHGLLPHYSAPNLSPHSRHAYTLHVTDARAILATQLAATRTGAIAARLLSLPRCRGPKLNR